MKKYQNRLSKLVLAAVALFAFTACDIIEGPKKDFSNLAQNSDKKVLVEDFTGHGCGNCPRAHETAAFLDSLYGDQVVIVAVHAGFFSSYGPGNPFGSEFTANYRTDLGTDLDAFYGADVAGYPKGLLNRRELSGKHLQEHTDWTGLVASLLQEDPKMKIDIAPTYDTGSRELSVQIDLEYFATSTADDQLVVVITEDSITSPQKDYSLPSPQVEENYVQRHVLRTNLSSDTWGDSFSTSPIAAGDRFSKTYNFTIPGEWDEHHCSVVAYVLDKNSKEIHDVEEKHLE